MNGEKQLYCLFNRKPYEKFVKIKSIHKNSYAIVFLQVNHLMYNSILEIKRDNISKSKINNNPEAGGLNGT